MNEEILAARAQLVLAILKYGNAYMSSSELLPENSKKCMEAIDNLIKVVQEQK
jgi:hypothetical protein